MQFYNPGNWFLAKVRKFEFRPLLSTKVLALSFKEIDIIPPEFFLISTFTEIVFFIKQLFKKNVPF